MAKFIFVTGGVVSSLGKGIASASIGLLLKSKGLRVTIQKLDPYINVDPGTMSPYQHGEVYVTEDGAETDLDLGHYERFTGLTMRQENNVTSGRVYHTVITKERRGDYLGGTVQVVPHITDEIKHSITRLAKNRPIDVVIVEVGGTVGDIESLPFLEAIRQLRFELGRGNTLSVHVTLVPFIEAAGELKTKPTQHSVGKLREIGIQPEVLLCRTSKVIAPSLLQKIALFCNVEPKAVIQARDVRNIYEVPLMFQEQGLDQLLLKQLGLKSKTTDLRDWRHYVVERALHPKHETRIAVVGKYVELQDAYKSIYEALRHGGIANNTRVEIKQVVAEDITKHGVEATLGDVHGVLVPGGFGSRGIEGKVEAIRYARERPMPFFGICLGMQCATIEVARHLAGMPRAHSTEFDRKSPHPVISLLEEQRKIKDLGGTMRLGAYECRLQPGTKARAAYGTSTIRERHRHRYEFNNRFRARLANAGLVVSGVHPRGQLVEIVELKDHPWFVACQFHPEFRSRPLEPHPLFAAFIKATLQRR